MNPLTPKAEKPKADTSGMPDIPLVLIPLDSDGTPPGCSAEVASAFADVVRKHAFIFSGPKSKIACFWETPKAIAGYLHIRLRGIGLTGAQPFGCILHDVPSGIPSLPRLSPLGIAVRNGGRTDRIVGLGGIVSFKDTCLILLANGMQAPQLQEKMKKMMMARMSVLEYRRAEREIASL